jgi:hypothetical protein
MSQVIDEVKQPRPSTKAENLDRVCMYFLFPLFMYFFVISGPFPGSWWLHFMQGMSS